MRKTKTLIFLGATVLSFILSTRSYAQTVIDKKDTICLSGTEFNYFIGCAYDSHTYREVIDSLRKQKSDLDRIVSNDSIIKESYDKIIKAKGGSLILADENIKDKKAQLERAEKKVKRLTIISQGLGLFGASILTYELIKR